MKAFVIGDKNNPISVQAVKACVASSNLDIKFVQQTCPETLKEHLENFPNLTWNYPLNYDKATNLETGMTLTPYKVRSLSRIFACTISHARLWRKCVELDEEIMILEHDAIFTREFTPFEWEGGALGLNDPRGATHSAMFYHEILQAQGKGVHEAPFVKPPLSMPQGLAGHSAYIIRPFAAEELLEKMKETGAWPNDALMCKQFFPWLRVVYPYFTRVQGVQSTTT